MTKMDRREQITILCRSFFPDQYSISKFNCTKFIKEQWKSLSKFDWLKRLKQKAGKVSIKSSASQACDIWA